MPLQRGISIRKRDLLRIKTRDQRANGPLRGQRGSAPPVWRTGQRPAFPLPKRPLASPLRRREAFDVGFHFLTDLAAHFDQFDGGSVEVFVFLRHRHPFRHRRRASGVVHGDHDDDAVGGQVALAFLGVAGVNADADVHGGAAGVDHLGGDLDQTADVDRLHEADAPGVGGDAVFAAPACRAGVGGKVDPLHHRAAVDFAAEVLVARLGHKAQGDFSLHIRHA